MARMKDGLMGGIQGNIGDVEGFIRFGVPHVRKKKRKSNIPRSKLQRIQQQGMVLANEFTNSMTQYIRLGFDFKARGQMYTPNNAAKSYFLKNSLTGKYPDISIDYPKVRLSEGKIELPENLEFTKEDDGLRFNWTYDLHKNWSDQRAQVMILVHAPETGKSHFIMSGSRMSSGTEFLELPPAWINLKLHVYLSFVSDDRKQISNSIYMGETP